MQIHDLKPKTKNKNKKRIARGGKRGTTSGRGQKGQRSRSGHKIRPAERDLIMRIPKLRGQKKPALKKNNKTVINLDKIQKSIKGNIINKKFLMEAGLIDDISRAVKILGSGRVEKNLQIEGLEVSKSVKEKIEKAGGSVK